MALTALAINCRVCLRDTSESYFEMNKGCYFSSDNQSFIEIFNFCTHLELKINTDLPQRICLLCVQDLQKIYEFLQRVLATNKKFEDLNECGYRSKDMFNDNTESTKDPLENATDSEDTSTLDNHSKAEFIEENHNAEDEYSRSSFDNADNTIKYAPVNDTHTSPLASENDDKIYGNFFKSVDAQIFPQGRIKCKTCHKAYFTAVGLQAHMDIHLPKRKIISKTLLRVNKCIKKTKVKSDISDAENPKDQNIKLKKDGSKIKLPKPKKLFPCEVCGKQMISASKLRYHMVMHTAKAYSTIYALKHHMRAHTGERPYECKFCGDRFLRPTTLKSHMRRHTGERPYGCDICGKRFIQHSSMATHMKLNHMDKTIPCPYCDKKYARKTDLNTHLLSHSGDKPFSCLICPSRFTRQSNLNKHMNQHHSNLNLGDKKCKNKTIYEVASERRDCGTTG